MKVAALITLLALASVIEGQRFGRGFRGGFRGGFGRFGGLGFGGLGFGGLGFGGLGMLGMGVGFPGMIPPFGIVPPVPFIPGMGMGVPPMIPPPIPPVVPPVGGVPPFGRRDIGEITVSNSTETLCELSTLTSKLICKG